MHSAEVRYKTFLSSSRLHVFLYVCTVFYRVTDYWIKYFYYFSDYWNHFFFHLITH